MEPRMEKQSRSVSRESGIIHPSICNPYAGDDGMQGGGSCCTF